MHSPSFTPLQRLEMFFRDPAEEPQLPGTLGTLYLLRRDIRDLQNALPEAAIWPRTMLVLAGIDLVAKFYCDNDNQRRVGGRFKTFVRERITHASPNAEGEAETVYQLRNSLLHSFGLYSQGRGRTYRFVVTHGSGNVLMTNDSANPEKWLVNLAVLQSRFEDAVMEYDRTLRSGEAPHPFSEALFDRYGWVSIR